MTDRIEPAEALAERILDDYPNIPGGAALIDADRAAVHRAALLEAAEKLEIMAGSPLGTSEAERALRWGVARLKKLAEEKKHV